jgi:hypothetical protein
MHDWLTHGNLSQVDGLSEGTGDYFAQSYSRGLNNFAWNANQAAYHYVYSWDGHNECWGGRTTNYNKTYPGGLVGQIHTDGQIWATCLMKVWDQIGKENTDTIVVEGLAMTSSNTSQQQAAQAVLQATVDVGLSQFVSTVQSTFQACGYDVSVQQANFAVTITTSGDETTNNSQTFVATVTGGEAPFTYAWDINNDTQIDGINNSISANYQQAYSDDITVQVTDNQGASVSTSISVNIQAPKVNLVTTTDNMQQVCGNNDGFVDPGERWKIPVKIQNNGFSDAHNAYAVFTKNTSSGGTSSLTATDSYGNSGGLCESQFIDISTTGTELQLTDANPNDDFSANDEGVASLTLPQSFNLYGNTVSRLYLSSNGYISTDATESGFDFDNSCPIPAMPSNSNINNGVSAQAKLMPLHDDLITQHIYHQHFSVCPRQSDLGNNLSCDVILYSDVDLFDNSNSTVEHFSFEAILYPTVNQWVYQYQGQGINPASSSVGLQSNNANDGLNFSCNSNGLITTQQAVCLYHKDNQPTAISNPSLFLETPVIAMGDLQIAQQHNGFVEFSVAENAQCGSAINLAMQAAVYTEGFNLDESNILSSELGNNGNCTLSTMCSVSDENTVEPTDGLWFNAQRPGNGHDMYLLENGLLYVQYTALEDSSPIWYITFGGDVQNNQAVNTINKVSYDGPFATSTKSTDAVGQSLTTFIDADTAIQTRTINGNFSADILSAFVFSNDETSEDRTGLWFSPQESGWGATIGTQGDTEVLIKYLYDNSGQPYWLLGSGINSAVENINLSYFKAFCPHCPAVPAIPTVVGTSRIDYDEGNSTATIQNMNVNVTETGHESQWNKSNLTFQSITNPPPVE